MMMRRTFYINKELFTVFIVMVMVAGIHFTRFFLKKEALPPVSLQGGVSSKAKGNPSAEVYIVEYSDFQCPACSYATKVLKRYYEQHSSRMYVEFKHYPIPKLHPYGVTSAVFAECAAQQGKFWDYHDRLFETQRKWSRSLDVKGALMEMAKGAGLEIKGFKVCVEDSSIEAGVLKEKFEGKARNVKATPTFFINGRMVVGGRSFEGEMEKVFKEEER